MRLVLWLCFSKNCLYVLESHTEILARKCCHVWDLNQGVVGVLGVGWGCVSSRIGHELAILELCGGSGGFIALFLTALHTFEIWPGTIWRKNATDKILASNPLPLTSVAFLFLWTEDIPERLNGNWKREGKESTGGKLSGGYFNGFFFQKLILISAMGCNGSRVKTQVSPLIMTLVFGCYVPGALLSAFYI